jgi:hypothetical protein
MSIDFDLNLFGKPGWMLPEGESITADQLRDLAEYLHGHLHCCAEVLEALSGKGMDESDVPVFNFASSKCTSAKHRTGRGLSEQGWN